MIIMCSISTDNTIFPTKIRSSPSFTQSDGWVGLFIRGQHDLKPQTWNSNLAKPCVETFNEFRFHRYSPSRILLSRLRRSATATAAAAKPANAFPGTPSDLSRWAHAAELTKKIQTVRAGPFTNKLNISSYNSYRYIYIYTYIYIYIHVLIKSYKQI